MKNTEKIFARVLVFLILLSIVNWPAIGTADQRSVLRERIDHLSSTDEPVVDRAPIAALALISKLYERREFQPVWTDRKMIEVLFEQVLRSVEHGLNPEDFHARQLGERLKPGPKNTSQAYAADTEILCTDAIVRLAVTLRFGKLDPKSLDPAWNFSRHISDRNPVTVFNEIFQKGDIAQALEAADPNTHFYNNLRKGLRTYRAVMANGGWHEIPSGPVLKKGDSGPRVPSLRARLRVTGDIFGPEILETDVFDSGLEAAVKRFQARHGIEADGKVGPRSLEELNVPVEVRINQIRASLERVRWVFRDIPGDYLIVDIAGFRAHLVEQGEPVWSTRVQVGKAVHATPVFKDTMRYLEFNPTWTIPPGILRNETLPAIRRDPDYLNRNNMSVVTTKGKIVDPSSIDWQSMNKGFPYMIRQEPGPNNALGRVKFMFPNKYMVYLHDTPSKGLFARAERAFSHGCIRTENPFDLAELLLDKQGWSRARIDQVVASKKNTRVNLENPITVMMLYWTATATDDGMVRFSKDVYNRDASVIRGLDEPFLISPPKGAVEAIEGMEF